MNNHMMLKRYIENLTKGMFVRVCVFVSLSFCVFIFCWGCDNQSENHPKNPKIIAKKIPVQADQSPKTDKTEDKVPEKKSLTETTVLKSEGVRPVVPQTAPSPQTVPSSPNSKVITKKIVYPPDEAPKREKGEAKVTEGTSIPTSVTTTTQPPAKTEKAEIKVAQAAPSVTTTTQSGSAGTVPSTMVKKPDSLPKSETSGTLVAKAAPSSTTSTTTPAQPSKPAEAVKPAEKAKPAEQTTGGVKQPETAKPETAEIKHPETVKTAQTEQVAAGGSQTQPAEKIDKSEPKPKEGTAHAEAAGTKDAGKALASVAGVAQGLISADAVAAYNPEGKIDPFSALFKDEPVKESVAEDKKEQQPKRPERVRRTPLEKVDLSQLKLVGIIRASSGNKALVEESSGKGYIIGTGTYIGIHYGKVSEILKDRVVVEEEDEDLLGKITMRKRELKLQKPPGEEEYHDL